TRAVAATVNIAALLMSARRPSTFGDVFCMMSSTGRCSGNPPAVARQFATRRPPWLDVSLTLSTCPIAIVAAPVEQVWGLLADPRRYALWWDAQTCSIIPDGPAQQGQ